jgi:tripartite-type tricarboxylate transporter receptor subunit TctC
MTPASPPWCRARRSTGGIAVASAGAFLLLLLAGPADAQFPTGPIEITVPFGVGNAADVSARHLADGLAKQLGVPVNVVNRPGGGVAFTHVVQQRPDGYMLGYITSTISTSYYSGILPFDYSAYAPVAGVTTETPVLVVRADAPWRTLKEMVEDAKGNPGKLRIGNSGTGTHTHLSAAALFGGAGASVVDVPFGAGQATVNLLGNRIEGVVQLPPAVIAHVRAGDLRVLAALGSRRDRIFPDTPTAGEVGFPVPLDLWRGVVAPKGTSAVVIEKLEEAIRRVVASPEFQAAGKELGFLPAFLSTNDFGNLISADDKKLAALMATLGLKKR